MDIMLDCETRGVEPFNFTPQHLEHTTLFNGWLKEPHWTENGGIYQDLETGVNKDARIVGHNIKYDYKCLLKQEYNLKTNKFYDTQIAFHLLREDLGREGYKLENLAHVFYNYPNYKGLTDFSSDYWSDYDTLLLYNRHDLLATHRLKEVTEPALRSRGLWPLFSMLMDYTKVLAQVEMLGIRIDLGELNEQERELQDRERKTLESLKSYSQEIDWESDTSQSVKEYFDNKIGLPKTKKKNLKLDDIVLKSIDLPEARLLQELREVHKLLHTYIEGIKGATYNGIYFGDYNQCNTVTGRLSERYLQVLPRGSTGRIKRIITSKFANGYLLEADWGSQEVRLVAERSGDKNLREQLNAGFDLHNETLQKFIRPLKERVRAKNVNFNVFFGGGVWLLVNTYGLRQDEAEALRHNLLVERYPGVKKWHYETERMLATGQPIKSLVGRQRHTDNRTEAINFPIQSTASEFNKVMMIFLFYALQNYQSHVIMDVHDSLIIDVCPEEKEEVIFLVKEAYKKFKDVWENYFGFRLVMDYTADYKIGKNLLEMEKV